MGPLAWRPNGSDVTAQLAGSELAKPIEIAQSCGLAVLVTFILCLWILTIKYFV
jgi:hypothetical protein